MALLDLFLHLAGLFAPALAVAFLVSTLARPVSRGAADQPWLRSFALDSIAGAAALLVGLWLFGHDGKMFTYAALVLACASCQWLLARGWR